MKKNLTFLGIETSCDETAASVIREKSDGTGDILSNIDLTSFYNFHVNIKSPLTLSYIIKDNPIDCGILEIDNHSKIIRFEEKPKIPFSNMIYSGIQIIKGNLFHKLPFNNLCKKKYRGLDFGFHVWPKLIGEMTGYKLDCYLIDIGNHESYKIAQNTWTEKK